MTYSCATLWTVACQAPLSKQFPRQGCWSGLSFPSPGDLPHPGIKYISPVSPALHSNSLPLSHQGNPILYKVPIVYIHQYQSPNSSHPTTSPLGRKKSKKEGIYMYIKLIHFAVKQKLTAHCKATVPIKASWKNKECKHCQVNHI